MSFFGITDYPSLCVAVLIFLALPGPGTFALLSSTARGGMRAGAAAIVGLIVGDQVLLWLAVAGVAAMLAAHPIWFDALKWLGAAYLVWVGSRLLLNRDGDRRRALPIEIKPGHYARQALAITLLNPKAIIFYMAFFPLFIDPPSHQGLVTFAAMAVTIVVLTAAYCLTLCALAQAVATALRAHRSVARGFERFAGGALIVFGIRLGAS